MKPEEQRIEIAKVCGWAHQPGMLKPWFNDRLPKHQRYCKVLPDYLGDLNAIHAAEKILYDNFDHYLVYLDKICTAKGRATEVATAAQRAEAFLRCIGKWQENPKKR